MAEELEAGYCFNGYPTGRWKRNEACQQIGTSSRKPKVLMLTSFAEDELLFAAIPAGATGYLLKQIASGGVIRAIERAARGESAGSSLTQKVFFEVRRSIRRKAIFPKTDKPGNVRFFPLVPRSHEPWIAAELSQ